MRYLVHRVQILFFILLVVVSFVVLAPGRSLSSEINDFIMNKCQAALRTYSGSDIAHYSGSFMQSCMREGRTAFANARTGCSDVCVRPDQVSPNDRAQCEDMCKKVFAD